MNTMPQPTPPKLDLYSYEQAQRIKELLSYHLGEPFFFGHQTQERHVLVLIQIIPCKDDNFYRINLVAQGAFLPVQQFCLLNDFNLPDL
ncbi:MAG: hypothetical protein ABWZ25_11850 [Chitinophagaceae bacterium]